MNTPHTKFCNKCKTELPIDHFLEKYRTKVKTYCKKCRIEYTREYRVKNRDALRRKQKDKRAVRSLLLELSKNKTSDIEYYKKEYNITISPSMFSEGKRKYIKPVHLTNVSVEKLDRESKTVILKLDEENMNYISHLYNDMLKDCRDDSNLTEVFILKDSTIIAVYHDILLLDYKYNELIEDFPDSIRYEPVDVVGNLIINYDSLTNNIIFMIKYIKETRI